MGRLVMVSNRVPEIADGAAAGGLAVGIGAALRHEGGLWFGWNGKLDEASSDGVESSVIEGVEYVRLRVLQELHERAYSGFANGTLWLLLHSFLDKFRYRDEDYAAYREVNALFARQLAKVLKADDVVWAHDYHLIPLVEELRALEVSARIGFFLHIPFPHLEILRALPRFDELLAALLHYDVIGFQTETDRQAFIGAAEAVSGSLSQKLDGSVLVDGKLIHVGVFPIGVDVDAVFKRRDGERSNSSRARHAGRLAGKEAHHRR